MKTTKIMIGMVAAWLAVAPVATNAAGVQEEPKATASTNLTVKINEVGKLVFRVKVENLTRKRVNIQIKDAESNILFEQFGASELQYLRNFDLSKLADGTYTFEVNAGKEKYSQSFQILTETNRTVSVAKN